MSIKILDAKVISQIAAGEVVERPSSVVKELVENALDAGSTQISVDVKGGGISLIRVTDNGLGIQDDEVELAFARHATSKIDSLQDLQHLSSLGFRGEALPSIAAVAQVQIVTRVKDATVGVYLRLEGGILVKRDSQARATGTTITVQNLFRKIPARLKFLKSVATEAGRIADIVSRYALAYPEVHFTLTSDDKTLLRTPGNGKLSESVSAVYGPEIARNMLEVKGPGDKYGGRENLIEVTGLVGSPRIARSTRGSLSFFVNRRWVNNRSLIFAAEEAYHGLLMQGKHPIAVININLPQDQTDVNVHPAKTEIRFQDERAVFGAVQKAVRQTLIQTGPVPQVEEMKTTFSAYQIQPGLNNPAKGTQVKPVQPSVTPLISLPLLRVLGQLMRSYIVAEGPDGLYLIDQHAAHERIQFEKIQKQYLTHKIDFQGLLEPVTFEVEPKQAAILSNHIGELSGFGFNIEVFGEKTYLVRSIPALLRGKDWVSVLRDALETGSNNWTETMLFTLACHSAIRAGQVLSESEMQELVNQLEQTNLPNSCPHGRPTMVQLTIQRIEKELGRI
jgi:DNA mismatch repair protein MutL